ncbi:hypothetical protein AK973_1870 [Pseudomonas brassicacearum]|nr:hypothetical protein AK973_1870 [Pseudomonas brassicacearum]
MKNHINVLGYVLAKVRISYIAIDHFNLTKAVDVFQPTPIVKRIVLGQRLYVIAFLHQQLNQVRANKTISARY